MKETVARLKEGPVMSYATVAARGLEKVSGREKRREITHEASEDRQEKVRTYVCRCKACGRAEANYERGCERVQGVDE